MATLFGNNINLNFSTATAQKEPMTIDNFLSQLFQFRDVAHLLHLKSTSYSEHVALNILYKKILKITDLLVETAQTESLLDLKISESKVESTTFDTITKQLEWIHTNRIIFPNSFQRNILDSLEEEYHHAIYRLKFLK